MPWKFGSKTEILVKVNVNLMTQVVCVVADTPRPIAVPRNNISADLDLGHHLFRWFCMTQHDVGKEHKLHLSARVLGKQVHLDFFTRLFASFLHLSFHFSCGCKASQSIWQAFATLLSSSLPHSRWNWFRYCCPMPSLRVLIPADSTRDSHWRNGGNTQSAASSM